MLEGLGKEMYIDDTDGSVLFMGVKTASESSQHIVRPPTPTPPHRTATGR